MIATIAIALAVIEVAFASSNLNAKAWKSAADYPVASDFPEYELLKDKPNTAIGKIDFISNI